MPPMYLSYFILLFLLVSSDLISQEKVQKNDFSNSKWGMKKDKVMSTEKCKKQPHADNNFRGR